MRLSYYNENSSSNKNNNDINFNDNGNANNNIAVTGKKSNHARNQLSNGNGNEARKGNRKKLNSFSCGTQIRSTHMCVCKHGLKALGKHFTSTGVHAHTQHTHPKL